MSGASPATNPYPNAAPKTSTSRPDTPMVNASTAPTSQAPTNAWRRITPSSRWAARSSPAIRAGEPNRSTASCSARSSVSPRSTPAATAARKWSSVSASARRPAPPVPASRSNSSSRYRSTALTALAPRASPRLSLFATAGLASLAPRASPGHRLRQCDRALDQLDRTGEAAPLAPLGGERGPAHRGQLVDPPAPRSLAAPPAGHATVAFEAVQGGVDRALRQVERAVRAVTQRADERVPVRGAGPG